MAALGKGRDLSQVSHAARLHRRLRIIVTAYASSIRHAHKIRLPAVVFAMATRAGLDFRVFYEAMMFRSLVARLALGIARMRLPGQNAQPVVRADRLAGRVAGGAVHFPDGMNR